MKAICKDLDNKNCSLKNEIKIIEDGGYLVCEECGGDLTVSNNLVKILFTCLALLLISGGVYMIDPISEKIFEPKKTPEPKKTTEAEKIPEAEKTPELGKI